MPKFSKDGSWIEPSDQEVYRSVKRWVILGVVAVVVIAVAVYAVTYFTAEPRGRVALHNQQRTAANLQFNYEYFHNACHTVLAETQQIKTVQAQVDDMKAHPPANDPFGQAQSQLIQLQTQLTGLQNQRDLAAQDYDSKSHQFTRDFMKSKDLPAEIGPPTGTPYDTLICEGAQP